MVTIKQWQIFMTWALLLRISVCVNVEGHFHMEAVRKETSTGFGNHYCGYKQMCECSDDLEMADCSRNYGNLTFIPELPLNVSFLNFTFNVVREIRNKSFFLNVTHVSTLDLGDNNLTSIVPDAFQLFQNLSFLFLDYNYHLTSQALPAVFSVRTLIRADIMHCKLGPLPDDIFHTYPLPRLESLYLHRNYLHQLNMSTFQPLPRLTRLGLGYCKINRVHWDQLDNLEKLSLKGNGLFDFPTTCNESDKSYFPRLTHLLLAYNLITIVPRDVCLPKLQVLQLSGNRLSVIYPDTFESRKFPSLLAVFLDHMHARVGAIEKNAFQSATLERIYFTYTNVDFASKTVHPECFAGCPNLTHLELSHTNLREVSDKKLQELFGNLTQLTYLLLGSTHLSNFTQTTFARLQSLEHLILYANQITSLPEGAFDQLRRLRCLDLHDNLISVISENTFGVELRRELSRLDLSENPFDCSCHLMWFRQWLITNPHLFENSFFGYRCSNIPHTNITSFYLNEQACLMTRDTYKFMTASLSMLISTLTLVSLLFRYRWHIRLVLYEAFRGRGEARRRRLQQQHFQYDVFVSYASEDLQWVRQHLMPELEERLGLRLCVHERDFIPGKPIVDNIEETLQTSKKVLMVFSTDFARSQWCQFELTLCLSHVMDYDDALLVVLLHDVPAHDMTSAMMAVLRTTTYIEWGEGPDARASFWGRIKIALNEILPAPEAP